MGKTEMKPVFKAKDDSEWPSAARAQARNAMIEAENKFKEAAQEVARRLKEAALTADGEPFATEGRYSDFWWLCPNYGGGLPRLHRVYVYPYLAEIEHDYQKNGRLVVREYKADTRSYITHPVEELYVSHAKAKAAHLAACEERLKEIEQEVADLRNQYKESR